MAMQSVVENMCRCFGTDNTAPTSEDLARAFSDPDRKKTSPGKPVTPDMKRRTQRLKLKDEQWDALFGESPKKDRSKRKRCMPNEIFRSKNKKAAANPFSRFLSNHPVIANSLCFATPIRDSDDDDNNSVVSESNTLNTAEDTITSTQYYEQVKLAGLKQKNPPMPLFNSSQIETGDEIRQVLSFSAGASASRKLASIAEREAPPAMTHVSSSSTSRSESSRRSA